MTGIAANDGREIRTRNRIHWNAFVEDQLQIDSIRRRKWLQRTRHDAASSRVCTVKQIHKKGDLRRDNLKLPILRVVRGARRIPSVSYFERAEQLVHERIA